jgi:O-antigen ligase
LENPTPPPEVVVTALLPFLALIPPSLLAFTLSPSATVLNQLLAIAGWAALVVFASGPLQMVARRAGALIGALAIYAVAALVPALGGDVPASLAASTFAITLAAGAVVLAGCVSGAADTRFGLSGFFAALLLVGAVNFAIAVVQVFLPDLPDGTFIAHSGLVGRAVGNLRQPNHLSTLSLWSAVGVVPLIEAARARGWRATQALLALLFALFVFTVELSASRTGMIGVVVLALWGLLDRRLARSTRALLVAAVLIYALGWVGMDAWAHHSHHTFGAEERLGQRDISSSRFGIWSETWTLLRANPFTGVGVNEFNFAWTLTPFPHRPPEFFDHCHNLPLELLVELGWPLGTLVVALLAIALWQAMRRAWRVTGEAGSAYRAAFVVVLLAALHSQLEYPLWYAYFLLPTAWAWGCCLGAAEPSNASVAEAAVGAANTVPSSTSGSATTAANPAATSPAASRGFFIVAGLLMLLGAAWAFQQYWTVSRIFEPGDDTLPLEQRIAQGRQTLFFAHHADYAAVTVADRPADEWPAFRVATHYLLDTRLMIAWATAFAERGQIDRARYIAARLREFDKPEAAEFFAPCAHPQPRQPLPFQCEPPQQPHDWREFRDPRLYR